MAQQSKKGAYPSAKTQFGATISSGGFLVVLIACTLLDMDLEKIKGIVLGLSAAPTSSELPCLKDVNEQAAHRTLRLHRNLVREEEKGEHKRELEITRLRYMLAAELRGMDHRYTTPASRERIQAACELIALGKWETRGVEQTSGEYDKLSAFMAKQCVWHHELDATRRERLVSSAPHGNVRGIPSGLALPREKSSLSFGDFWVNYHSQHKPVLIGGMSERMFPQTKGRAFLERVVQLCGDRIVSPKRWWASQEKKIGGGVDRNVVPPWAGLEDMPAMTLASFVDQEMTEKDEKRDSPLYVFDWGLPGQLQRLILTLTLTLTLTVNVTIRAVQRSTQ